MTSNDLRNLQDAKDGTPSVVSSVEDDAVEILDKYQGRLCYIFQPWLRIQFQSGPVKVHGVNGVQIDDVIRVLIDRLEAFQKGSFGCEDNAHTLVALREALRIQQARTKKRTDQGVEGTNQSHKDNS